MTQSLDLFPIGNCAASGLIDRAGRLVWACVPRVDGDPVFSALLNGDPDEHADADDCVTGVRALADVLEILVGDINPAAGHLGAGDE